MATLDKKPKVAVLNAAKLNFDGKITFERLEAICHLTIYDDTTPDQVAERAAGCSVLITKEMPVLATVMAALPSTVSLIVEAGTGFNNLDGAAAKARGITCCNVSSYSTDAVAQLVVTYMMAFSCSLTQQQRKLERDDAIGWRSLGTALPHFELAGKTLGLVGGRGAIGSRVAEIARVLGMRVLVSSRSMPASSSVAASAAPGAEAANAAAVGGVGGGRGGGAGGGEGGGAAVQIVTLPQLLSESDFVSIHCPLGEGTRGLIGAAELKAMKRTAYLINTARGPIVDETALADAIEGGVIAGAALDVQEVEPLPTTSPLLTMQNVILTPHIGWQRVETRQRLIDTVVGNIEAFVNDKPINVVNP